MLNFKPGNTHRLRAAARELQRLSQLPWDELPNVAPCTGWVTCGRKYEVVEYDTSAQPWHELNRIPALEIDANGVRWVAAELRALAFQ